jgi:hypothetical protein
MRLFDSTVPRWLPTQLEVLQAERDAWEQWRVQNRQLRLTHRVQQRRADLWIAAGIGASAMLLVVIIVASTL